MQLEKISCDFDINILPIDIYQSFHSVNQSFFKTRKNYIVIERDYTLEGD